MNNEQLLEEIHIVKNHSDCTKLVYKQAVGKYTAFCEKSMEELLEEAEDEEDKGVRWKKRTLKRRLLSFRLLIALVVSVVSKELARLTGPAGPVFRPERERQFGYHENDLPAFRPARQGCLSCTGLGPLCDRGLSERRQFC